MPATDTSFPQSAPQPARDADSAPFWAALEAGEIRVQFSPAAGRWQFPPLERCRHSAGALEWRAIQGAATIHSFIVQHRPAAPGFAVAVPYVIALAVPDEAPDVRLPVRVVEAAPDEVAVGGAIRLAVERPAAGVPSIVARLAREQGR